MTFGATSSTRSHTSSSRTTVADPETVESGFSSSIMDSHMATPGGGGSRSNSGSDRSTRSSRMSRAMPLVPRARRATVSKPETPGNDASPTKKPSTRARATFVTCRSYPEAMPLPPPVQEEGELQRSQRRSKQEALTRIDRVGTPMQFGNGPTATSFIPPPPPPAGPSTLRNPLNRPQPPNPPFDISSVRTEAPRYPPKRTSPRLFDLPECPTYYPTPQQFLDPMAYIASIGAEASQYGICKIVPPEGWRMPFALETDTFRFKTRLQRLNSLEAASRAKINFLDQLGMFHRQQGDAKVTIPSFDRQRLDVWRLRKEVAKLGGFDEVTRKKAWDTMATAVGCKADFGAAVQDAYRRIILPFDRYIMRAKSASVSPLTPLTNHLSGSALPKPPGFAMDTPTSPTRSGRIGNTRSISTGRMGGMERVSPSPLPLPTSQARSVSAMPDMVSLPSASTPGPSYNIKVPGFANGDGSESELSEADSPMSSVPSPHSPPQATVPYQKGEVCEVCRGGHAPEKMLLCDDCDRGFHTYCLDPPLKSVPTNEEWFCTACLLGQGDDYGFETGDEHSIPSFQARDGAFAYSWWTKHRPEQTTPDPTARWFGKVAVGEDDVEKEFWRLTESATETLEVEYGADIHSTTHGSAAPSLETHPLEPYARDPWNLNNMPILQESLLRYIKSDISGMTVPWIYLGMLFSTFCWHNEDHYTYSVNYMHWGETKTWYGVPGADADKFEEAIKSEAPELFEQQPSLLYELTTLMNPGRLREAGVRVVACNQRPNEFVITWPKAYHCGFNHGINFNEAVNFALPDWLKYGKECVVKYKQHIKAPVFSHNELLVTITLYSDSIKTAMWLQYSLAEMVAEETRRRERLRDVVPLLNEQLVEEDCPEDQYQCFVCKGFCYLSQITCTCTKNITCIDHADSLCGCPATKRTLRKRYSENQLNEILEEIQTRAHLPMAWRERLYGLLSVPRPQLKSMRALLADGEKIDHNIMEMDALRAMVTRANVWAERVTALSTRKSTGRRKKGRQSTANDDDGEADRRPQVIRELLAEAERLAFDTPEILQLRQIIHSIDDFERQAAVILTTPTDQLDLEQCRTVLILGQSANIDLPEVHQLRTIVSRLEWFKKVEEDVDDRTLQYADVLQLLEEAEEFGISADHPGVIELRKREQAGRRWADAVQALLRAPQISFDDLDRLIEGQELVPTSLDQMRALETIRKTAQGWQTSARQILAEPATATATAITRLCRNVRGAQGPVSKITIPEIAELQSELDFHAQWYKEVADLIGSQPGRVPGAIEDIVTGFRQNLGPEDDEPNPDHVCICRDPPNGLMVKCEICKGDYHAKCVGVAAKNAGEPYRCSICGPTFPDTRTSLHRLAYLADDISHWNFLVPPPELTLLKGAIEMAIRYARVVVPLIDPMFQAHASADAEILAHHARKLYWLPVTFDGLYGNKRVVFEQIIGKRLYDSRMPANPKPRMRPRRPKFILRQARDKTFHCLCSHLPADYLVVVHCHKCGQGYHASCVSAPDDVLGEGAKPWRCPCCSVKEGKHYQKNRDVRVQMTEHMGTDIFVDYRQTIVSFAKAPIEYRAPRPGPEGIVLEATDFIPPVIPEGHAINGNAHPDGGDDTPNGPTAKRRKTQANRNGIKLEPSPIPSESTLAPRQNGSTSIATPPPTGLPQSASQSALNPAATSNPSPSVSQPVPENRAPPSTPPAMHRPTPLGLTQHPVSPARVRPPSPRTIYDASSSNQLNRSGAQAPHPYVNGQRWASSRVVKPTEYTPAPRPPQAAGPTTSYVNGSRFGAGWLQPQFPPYNTAVVSKAATPAPTVATAPAQPQTSATLNAVAASTPVRPISNDHQNSYSASSASSASSALASKPPASPAAPAAPAAIAPPAAPAAAVRAPPSSEPAVSGNGLDARDVQR